MRRPARLRPFAVVALALAVVASLLLAACGGASEPGQASPAAQASQASPAYTDVSPDELAAMLQSKDFVLVNTHIPYEGELPQTDLFIPYDQAAEQVVKLPADKAAKIVVYCRSDRMSRIAADAWAKLGFTNLYNLDGGFEAWGAAGPERQQRPQQ